MNSRSIKLKPLDSTNQYEIKSSTRELHEIDLWIHRFKLNQLLLHECNNTNQEFNEVIEIHNEDKTNKPQSLMN